ncbi:MAG: response regulator transcription factor [Porphyrobacter sp.]|nr:response regulator transcription factor [Porphyrobacter sp.]
MNASFSQLDCESLLSRDLDTARAADLTKTRVLLAEDHVLVRHGMQSLIAEDRHYEVAGEPVGGPDALEAARQTNPDLVVIDCSHPRARGLSLARQMKEAFPRLEIVLFLSFNLESVIHEAIEIGVLGLVLKSELENHLLAALDAASVRRRYVSPGLADAWYYATRRKCTPSLTRREHEVVLLIAEGNTYDEISQRLEISKVTLNVYRTNAMTKLGLTSTADLVRYAVRNDLIIA